MKLDNSEKSIDNDFYLSLICFNTEQTICKMTNRMVAGVNIALVTMQFICVLASLVLSVYDIGVNISRYTTVINLTILVAVMVNSIIGCKSQYKIREGLNILTKELQILMDSDLPDDIKQMHLNYIQGANVTNSDTYFQELMMTWYKYARMSKQKPTKYKDESGNTFCVGDIVYNPCFGDVWLLEELDEQKQKCFGFDTPYVFTQYGNADNYIMEIDEPKGFVVIGHSSDLPLYIKYLIMFTKQYLLETEEEENDEG